MRVQYTLLNTLHNTKYTIHIIHFSRHRFGANAHLTHCTRLRLARLDLVHYLSKHHRRHHYHYHYRYHHHRLDLVHYLALFDMPNLNRFDILSISIFCKIALLISISISIFSKITISISISISIFFELPYQYRYFQI